MPGPNTTGTSNTQDYLLGRGKLYFALLDATTKRPKGYRFLGNAPEFNLSIAKEELEHRSSQEGLRTIDKTITISRDLNFSFNLEEINHENLAAVFSGGKAAHTNVAVAGFGSHAMVADGDLEAGRWYDLVNSSGARAYDIDSTKLTVTTSAPTAMVLNTDYTLDAEMGRIFMLSTSSVVAAAVIAGDGLLVTLTADGTARDVAEVQALTQTEVTGALKFISINPASDDHQTEYQFHQINLSSEGDFSLISDEITSMPFTGAAQRNITASPTSPTLTIRDVAAET